MVATSNEYANDEDDNNKDYDNNNVDNSKDARMWQNMQQMVIIDAATNLAQRLRLLMQMQMMKMKQQQHDDNNHADNSQDARKWPNMRKMALIDAATDWVQRSWPLVPKKERKAANSSLWAKDKRAEVTTSSTRAIEWVTISQP